MLLDELFRNAKNPDEPFLAWRGGNLSLARVAGEKAALDGVNSGDVVALVGDFDAESLAALFLLLDRGAIIMPLTEETRSQHDYFFTAGLADCVWEHGAVRQLRKTPARHPLLGALREKGHAGLILFSSGSTGLPKAILHDFTRFLARYRTPRPALRTLNFLLFDHIGGLNTLFHTLFNNGLIIRPTNRTPSDIVSDIANHGVELLPATPTFLRMLLLSGVLREIAMPSLRLVTYGTERMDEPTLQAIAAALPAVGIRQTYGMSELGILRIKTKARDQLWIQVGGEGVTTAIRGGELFIHATNRMEGYLNAPSPFTDDGWYPTGDMVDSDGEWLRITGRKDDIINVGGLKVLPALVERAALEFPGVCFAKAQGAANPLTGSHVELAVQPEEGREMNLVALKAHLRSALPPHVVPRRVVVAEVAVGHRFKKL